MENSLRSNPFRLSIFALIITGIYMVLFFNFWKNWKQGDNQFKYDVDQYYSYLPAAFIHHDLSYNFPNYYWTLPLPTGKKVVRYTCGMAIMYSPFFALGHKVAINTKAPLTGYSVPYSDCIHYGTFFYVMMGLIFLRFALRKFFPDTTVALTLICIFFGTNLLNYTMLDGEYSHSYLFCLMSIFMWLVIKWYEKPKLKHAFFLGFVCGFMTLIRPTEILTVTIIILFGVSSLALFKQNINFLFSRWKHLLMMAAAFIIALLPQLIYWKWATGSFVFYSYDKEGFFLTDPKILEVLFSYRKGWLLYTPMMAFSLIGLFFMKGPLKKLRLGITVFFILNLYVISSWWCWWYGGSFGMRALIESYAILAFPFAGFVNYVITANYKNIFANTALKYIPFVLMAFFIYMNHLQNFQFLKGYIHTHAMTKKAYWLMFLKTEFINEDVNNYIKYVEEPDWEGALNGTNR